MERSLFSIRFTAGSTDIVLGGQTHRCWTISDWWTRHKLARKKKENLGIVGLSSQFQMVKMQSKMVLRRKKPTLILSQ